VAKRSKSKAKGPSLKKLMDSGKPKPSAAAALYPHLPSGLIAAATAMAASKKGRR
jgi:hypothetical protein